MLVEIYYNDVLLVKRLMHVMVNKEELKPKLPATEPKSIETLSLNNLLDL